MTELNHHAYLYEGSLTQFDALKEHLHPFVAQKFERLGMDDARQLVAMAALKKEGPATYLVAASSITTEAQQALLKLLEEPQAGVTFVLLMPHGALLPTVRSRLQMYPSFQGSPLENGLARKFLAANGKARSDLVAVMLKDEEGVKERVLDFVNAQEALLYQRHAARSDLAVRQGLQDIARVRSYLGDRSPSLKMLLEHLALSLPQ